MDWSFKKEQKEKQNVFNLVLKLENCQNHVNFLPVSDRKSTSGKTYTIKEADYF